MKDSSKSHWLKIPLKERIKIVLYFSGLGLLLGMFLFSLFTILTSRTLPMSVSSCQIICNEELKNTTSARDQIETTISSEIDNKSSVVSSHTVNESFLVNTPWVKI